MSEDDEEFCSGDGNPRRTFRRLRSEQVDALVEGYLQGSSAAQLAVQFDVARNTVLEHLALRQVPDRPYRKVHGELFDRAVALYEAGESLRSVATEVGVTRGALTDAFRLRGVVIRTRRVEL